MIELVFARHGETENNKNGILMGQLDSPLNENGLREAEELAESLKKFKFDVILTSDLKRAMQCCEKISNVFPAVKVIEVPLLRERYFGEHQGKKLTDVGYADLTYPTMCRHLYECDCPDGETNKKLLKRIEKFLRKCIVSYQNKRILVVTHGGVIMLALNLVLGEEIKFENSRKHKNGYVSYIKMEDNLEVVDSLINVHCSELVKLSAL